LNMCFEVWYYYSINCEEIKNKLVTLYELFEINQDEYNIIVNKLNDFQIKQGNHSKNYKTSWKIELLTDYLDMYLTQMNADELKEYIINIMDPIEPK